MIPLRFGFPEGGIAHPSTDPLPLHERVAAKLLARQAQMAPERPFVGFGGKWLTYGEADARANRVANALASLGIGKGMRVGILLRNRFEFLDLWFGLSRLGAIQVPLNPEYRAAQLEHVFRRAPIELVVAEQALLDELQVALSTLDRQPMLMTLDAAPASQVGLCYEDALGSASALPPAGAEAVSGADPGAVMNTSGTTGPSKGVLLSHAQQYILGRNLAADMDLGPDDVFYNFFPLFHNTAQAMITVPVLLVGARMILTEKFSASRFWPEVTEHECTAFYFIGEIIHILLKSTTAHDALGSRLRVGWGIGARPKDQVEFQTRFRVALRTGYGSTEANVPCVLPHDAKDIESAGRAIPGFEIRIADASDEPVAAGMQGEILVRANEPFSLMLGYDGDPAATVAAWRNLWLHTGDAATINENGDIYYKGRVKDSIRVRGENISAFEVEQVIGELPQVAEVAAIAVPGELGGDDLKIVVVRKAGAELTPEALIAHAQTCLPRYSIPRYVEFVSELPKTATNKVQKHVLRSMPFTPATWDRTRA